METSFEKNTRSPNCVGHPHAENMKLYAEDAMTTNEPWKLWEVCMHGEWSSLLTNPAWNTNRQYRRKPKIININGFKVPSPLRNPPNDGEICYIVNLAEDKVYATVWHSAQPFFKQWLKSGIIHRTEEAAALHLKALLSFTQQP